MQTQKELILAGAEWGHNKLNSSGYAVDWSVESLREVDHFLDENVEDIRQ